VLPLIECYIKTLLLIIIKWKAKSPKGNDKNINLSHAFIELHNEFHWMTTVSDEYCSVLFFYLQYL